MSALINNSAADSNQDVGPVELGYAEETESWRLESHFFVSKIGGKPSWLSFKPLPTIDSLKCVVCAEPMAFLLQIYAPLTEKLTTFHRTIFLFLCRNPKCSQLNRADNIVVFRCQLPRSNEFYSNDALDPEDFDKSKILRVESFSKVCLVCGCFGDKQCAQCKSVSYCSKSHQLLHWKLAHKQECKENLPMQSFENMFLFPEFELTIETEEFFDEKMEKERSEAERMKDYEKFLASHSKKSAVTAPLIEKDDENFDELETVVKKKDKVFKQFQRRIEQNPEQVIRYQRKGEPLWATKFTPKPTDIPDCSVCGSPRVFEFQVMPHLLSFLDVDCVGQSIDWGTLSVYTCSESCDLKDNGYAAEFVFKQDFVD